jgi:hypothetical protein
MNCMRSDCLSLRIGRRLHFEPSEIKFPGITAKCKLLLLSILSEKS